jgi:hypothetical protein
MVIHHSEAYPYQPGGVLARRRYAPVVSDGTRILVGSGTRTLAQMQAWRNSLDANMLRFFTAASITNAGQKLAIANLISALKAAGLWSKLFALYPFVGGNATAHAQNLLSASYPITWAGGITHDPNGVTGNGTTGTGLCTGLGGVSAMTVSNASIGVYARSDGSSGNRLALGAIAGGNAIVLRPRHSDAFDFAIGTLVNSGPSATTAVGLKGFSSNGTIHAYERGSDIGTSRAATGTKPAAEIYLLSIDGAQDFSTANLAAAYAGAYLTAPENATLNEIIQDYQTALGRNV